MSGTDDNKKTWCRREIQTLITDWKASPELWDVKHKLYGNRFQKQMTLLKLATKLNTTSDEINRKLHNLRNRFYYEVRKFKSKTIEDEHYESMWEFFEPLKFISSQPISASTLIMENTKYNIEDSSFAEQQYCSVTIENNETPSTSSNNDVYRLPIKRKLKDEAKDFKRPRQLVTEDRCDIIGKNVEMKLVALDAKQILVAEKLINDLLFEAELGYLSPEHAYINIGKVLRQFAPARSSSPTSNKTDGEDTMEEGETSENTVVDVKSLSHEPIKENSRPDFGHLLQQAVQLIDNPVDDFQIFGDYVASELRNLSSVENQRSLKLEIQRAILRASELDLMQSSQRC